MGRAGRGHRRGSRLHRYEPPDGVVSDADADADALASAGYGMDEDYCSWNFEGYYDEPSDDYDGDY